MDVAECQVAFRRCGDFARLDQLRSEIDAIVAEIEGEEVEA